MGVTGWVDLGVLEKTHVLHQQQDFTYYNRFVADLWLNDQRTFFLYRTFVSDKTSQILQIAF